MNNTLYKTEKLQKISKFVTIRKQDLVWLTNDIRKVIKKKN